MILVDTSMRLVCRATDRPRPGPVLTAARATAQAGGGGGRRSAWGRHHESGDGAAAHGVDVRPIALEEQPGGHGCGHQAQGLGFRVRTRDQKPGGRGLAARALRRRGGADPRVAAAPALSVTMVMSSTP